MHIWAAFGLCFYLFGGRFTYAFPLSNSWFSIPVLSLFWTNVRSSVLSEGKAAYLMFQSIVGILVGILAALCLLVAILPSALEGRTSVAWGPRVGGKH